ncbi:MAG: tetratricopeptide repeat protein [Flavobacteriales bacterium]|nr:tetratricopeptide repeat protein [Flavobacteriales bacterium]
MKHLLYTILFFCILWTHNGFSQDINALDSLKNELKTVKNDTIKLQLLSHIIEIENEEDVWPKYNLQMKLLAEKVIVSKKTKSEVNVAMQYLAEAYNNIGYQLDNQGNIPLALENYEKALKIHEKENNKLGIGVALLNIGAIFGKQEEFEKALEYYKKGFDFFNEINHKNRAALALNNMGFIYNTTGDTSKAMNTFKQGLKVSEEINDSFLIVLFLGNISTIYSQNGEFQTALEYANKGLEISLKNNFHQNTAKLYNVIGNIYKYQGNYNEAKAFFIKSYELSKKIRNPEVNGIAASGLKIIYETQKKYELAYKYFKEEIQMRDSVQNESNFRHSIQLKSKYEYEKKAATDSIANAKEKEITDAEIAQQQSEIKAKRNQQYGLIGGIILVVVFAGVVYNRLKVTQQQKRIIEEQKIEVEKQKLIVEKQKEIVEEKQEEILSSIRYARRIQDAIITPIGYIEKNINRLKRIY